MPAVPVRRISVSAHELALTFDDGPSEWTEPILDVLREHRVRATFFVIGDNILGNEDTLRRHHEGHEVGNHTMTHPPLTTLDREEIRCELTLTDRAIESVLGLRPQVFRPPHFGYNDAVADVVDECGFEHIVNAEVWTPDWNEPDSDQIVDAIVTRARAGSIVDLHDGRPRNEPPFGAGGSRESRQPTVDAVRQIVPRLNAEGFSCVTVSELLAL